MFRRLVFLLGLVLISAVPAAAQTARPYILGEVGGSFGDGGTAPTGALGFGYLTPHNVGFEIEVSYVPDLEFGDPGFPRIAIFPPVTLDSTGRVLALQTNVIGVLPGSGTKLRAFVLAGGGIADVEHRIRVESPLFFPEFPPMFGGPNRPVLFDRSTVESTQSETSLVLSAGAGFEYALTDHLGLGVSVRYQSVFSDPRRLDLARAAMRATWRF